MSKNGNINWPSTSPDLTLPDFFLWRYLKSKVYDCEPQTLDELNDSTRVEMRTIPIDMLEKVMEKVAKRAEFAVVNTSSHEVYLSILNAHSVYYL